ncbi:MAG: M20 family metallopeptidase [Candidatus Methylumidiphilus sp.]
MTYAYEKVCQAIKPERLRKTLLDLLSIYSPSGKEGDIQLYLGQLLTQAGFVVERQAVEGGRHNLHVTMGRGESQLYMIGHVDTVPAWDLEAFGPGQDGDIIHGLGSADMKGGCAAMVEAWLALAEALPPPDRPPVGLLLVVGEEENGDGSAAFLEACHPPPWAVIGEPTGLVACFAHYGYLEAGFVTTGIRCHSSLPERGHNAIESMLRVLMHLWGNPLFEREKSGIVYSIREMSSSRAGFVVPDRCETWIDLHLQPGKDPAVLQETIRRIAATAGQSIPGLDLQLDFDFASLGYNLGTDNYIAQSLSAIYQSLGLPLRLDAFRSHSDGNLFFAAGSQPIILGPGALEVAHTSAEQVSFSEVSAAADIYAALCLEVDSPGLKRHR